MKFTSFLTAVFAGALLPLTLGALDIMDGVMYAVPAPSNVKIDGKLKDWDSAGKEWLTVSRDVADRFSGDVMVMYDDNALYLAADILTGGGPMKNTNKPGEKPWIGHNLEFRCIATPKAPHPLRIARNDRNDPSVKAYAPFIKTMAIWMETVTRTPHITIQDGPPYQGEMIHDPQGIQLAFGETGNPDRYQMEARIPWTLLGVKDGKNPFRPGQAMTAFWTVLWPQSITQRAEALRTAPTTGFGWAWHGVEKWGRIVFAPNNKLPRRNPDLATYLAQTEKAPDCDSFTVQMPCDGMLSVNIFGKDGSILREIAGGEPHRKGPVTLYWDGFDWRGNKMPVGEYTWKAYVHDPLKVSFTGAAGTSAKIPYETQDGRGNWGGNMGPATAVSSDEQGLYYLWGSNEGGHSIVKTDFDNNVLWRTTPYVIEGGYGPHTAIGANRRYVYVLSGWFNTFLTRYDAKTGLTAPFGSRRFLTLDSFGKTPPQQLDWNTPMPSANSVAVTDTELFVPLHYKGKILVFDAETGALKRTLPCEWARGVALDRNGDLYVLTMRDTNGWHNRGAELHRFAKAQGKSRVVMRLPGQLQNPWGITIHDGKFYISDNGYSNQIWIASKGKILGTLGREGGRPWFGKYDPTGLLHPAGIHIDRFGKLHVAQAAIPSVFQKYDAGTLSLEGELFGEVGYCPPSWPDCDDPLLVYVKDYFSNGLIRSRLKGDGSSSGTEAYWRFSKMDWPYALRNWLSNYKVPRVFRGPGGLKYMFAAGLDANPAVLVRVEGDTLKPVNSFGTDGIRTGLEVWSDRNGNGKIDPEELRIIPKLAGRVLDAKWRAQASKVDDRGNIYLTASDNKVYFIPFLSQGRNGCMQWDFDRSKILVQEIIPGARTPLFYTAREQITGIDEDSRGNLYLSFNTNLKYASPEWTSKLKFGLGHTGRFNAVKIVSFDPQGRQRFLVGRKATGVLRNGEMYHHWTQAGMLGDHYVAVGSEWTPFTLYTSDGFFVQSLLADPNRGETPSPFSLGGGETFAGQLRYFPERSEAYLYTGNTHGMVYRIEGLDKEGIVKGEKRFSGKMKLTRHLDPFAEKTETAKVIFEPLHDPLRTGEWKRSVVLNDNSGHPLADVSFGYDKEFLYARFLVRNPKKFVNRADDPAMAFKMGDSVGFYLGRPGAKGPVDPVRILATILKGKAVVIGYFPKAVTGKLPYEYFTSAGGRVKYEFAGILPGARALYRPTAGGYVFELAVPRALLPDYEFRKGGKIALEAEVLLSGNGIRGLQTLSRNHLFTPRSAGQAKMVDDIPSEARIYPQYMQNAEIR